MDAKMDIKTAGRTLDVFEAFEATKKPVSLSELAAQIGAPMSSCHGLVRTLRNRGYLYSVAGRSMLYPTKRLLEVATTIAAHDPILERLGPLLVALRDETEETVILGKRQDDHITYLEVIEGLHTIRYAAKPGKIVPLHSSAIGKAYLGSFKEAELEKFIRENKLERITSNTLTGSAELIEDIRSSSERGYYLTSGENVVDVMGIARIIGIGSNLLGLAIAGPLPRMKANLDHYVAKLKAACTNLENIEDFR